MAFRLFRGAKVGGQFPGGHHHLPLEDDAGADRFGDEAEHPHDGVDLGEIAAGGAQLLPDVGHRVDAQHLHPQVRQMEKIGGHVVEHRRVFVVQVPLVGMKGGADVFLHLRLPDEAAGGGFREDIGDGLFHLLGDIRGVKADIPVDVFLLPGLGPHGPFMGIRRVVDDKIQAEAHPPAAHGGGEALQILVAPQGGVHLAEVLHRVPPVVFRVGHFQKGHQVQVGDALLGKVVQLLFQPRQVAGEEIHIHGHPQHIPPAKPLGILLPAAVQPPQAEAPLGVEAGHHLLQGGKTLPVVIKLHIEPIQLLLALGQASFKGGHLGTSPYRFASRRRTSASSGILRKAPFRVVTSPAAALAKESISPRRSSSRFFRPHSRI